MMAGSRGRKHPVRQRVRTRRKSNVLPFVHETGSPGLTMRQGVFSSPSEGPKFNSRTCQAPFRITPVVRHSLHTIPGTCLRTTFLCMRKIGCKTKIWGRTAELDANRTNICSTPAHWRPSMGNECRKGRRSDRVTVCQSCPIQDKWWIGCELSW